MTTYKKQPVQNLTGHSAAQLPERPITARTVGYARVSTEEQILDVQMTALRAAGCDKTFEEKISALNAKRPQFNLMMKYLEGGDTLIVHSLSRLGRDVHQIHRILKELADLGVTWRSLTEPHLDMTTAAGRLMVNVTGAMAQFERDQIVDRTKRGMDERKRQGMYLGRPKKVDDALASVMRRERKTMTPAQIAARHKLSVGTVNKYAPAGAR